MRVDNQVLFNFDDPGYVNIEWKLTHKSCILHGVL